MSHLLVVQSGQYETKSLEEARVNSHVRQGVDKRCLWTVWSAEGAAGWAGLPVLRTSFGSGDPDSAP
jgi:hypothetical protein